MDKFGKEYLDLLKWTLTDFHRADQAEYKPIYRNSGTFREGLLLKLDSFLNKRGFSLCRKVVSDKDSRLNGLDWPAYAETMIDLKRLNNIEECLIDINLNNIEGDLIETGVWRGGSTIFMRAVLKVLGDTNRTVWVADSFEGLPKPDAEKYPEDQGDSHFEKTELSISLKQVKKNFEKYGLLDDQVKFLKGWFKDTLPTAPIAKLSLLRLDGDMYQSTMEGLVSLYPRVSKGGYIIVDDWAAVEGCRKAVEDYRKLNGISDEILPIDRSAVYWKKGS